jgi:hypothetical protein
VTFAFAVFLVGVVGSLMAALTGAGIGSTLVPLFAAKVDFKVAVAAATVPHLVGSVMRAAQLWKDVDRALLVRFGSLSAAGSLAGAFLHTRIRGPAVTFLFAALLVMAGALGLLGLSEKVRLRGAGSWIAGALSGLFGGVAGEQGGLRAVGLLGFDLRREAFVAAATAVAVVVDAVRAPIYLVTQWDAVEPLAGLLALAGAAVVAGTWLGGRMRERVPEGAFRRVVSAVVLLIGVLLLLRSGASA